MEELMLHFLIMDVENKKVVQSRELGFVSSYMYMMC